MYTKWFLVIDVLAAAKNNPDGFIQECFGENYNPGKAEYMPDLYPMTVLWQKADGDPIKFYKSLDLAYQIEMEKHLTEKLQEHREIMLGPNDW